MVLAVVVCIKLGLWQQHKAEAKQQLQTQFDLRLQQPPVALPNKIDDLEAWRYRHVQLRGRYEPRYQILLDNQVDGEIAGYHVITPLLLADGSHVLVNRGWVAALADHSVLPPVNTPEGEQEVVGYVWLPPSKVFTLQHLAPDQGWQPVWQILDIKRYAALVPFGVQPLVVRLDPSSNASGFARNWPRPAERIEMHIGYAYQWYGFALAFLLIYLVVNFRKSNGS